MLSNIHKEDITYLSRQVSSSTSTEYYAMKIGNEYGYKYAYVYLDLFVKPDKNRRDKIKEYTSKLSRIIIKRLKQSIWNQLKKNFQKKYV
jgi:hypothetical protein